MAVDFDRSVCEPLVAEWTSRALHAPLPVESPFHDRALSALESSLALHVALFRETDGEATVHHVLRCLRAGQAATKTISTWDWAGDVLLAALTGHSHETATRLFWERYTPQFRTWARRYMPRDPDFGDEFTAAVVTGCEGREPRILSYHGKGPLLSWLRRAFSRDAFAAQKAVKSQEDATSSEPVAHSDEPGTDYDRHYCMSHLKPYFLRSIDCLSARERLVVLLAVLDEVPQNRIARLIGVDPGTVTRMKQKALSRVEAEFVRLATGEGGAKPETVGVCAGLLLDWSGWERLDRKALQVKLGGAQSTEISASIERRAEARPSAETDLPRQSGDAGRRSS